MYVDATLSTKQHFTGALQDFGQFSTSDNQSNVTSHEKKILTTITQNILVMYTLQIINVSQLQVSCSHGKVHLGP